MATALTALVIPTESKALFHPENAKHSAASPLALNASLRSIEGGNEQTPSSVDEQPRRCGTSDLLELDRAWTQLSPLQKERLIQAIAPRRSTAQGRRAGDSSERGTIACFLTLDNVVESEHFSIQWGHLGGVSTSVAESMLANLEAARESYLAAGYANPLGDPSHRIPVYLGNSGGSSPSINFNGGYATVCDSYQHAYIVMSNITGSTDSFDVVNHELFHTVQMGSPEPYSVESFYWEASAVWAEQIAAPERTYYAWPLPAYSNHPDWPMALENEIASNDGFLHRYAMFILSIYIEEFAPLGPDALLEVWNGQGKGLINRLEGFWTDQKVDTNFAEQFGHFTSHVALMDFDHQGAYLALAPVQIHESLEPGDQHTEEYPPDTYGSHFYEIDVGGPDEQLSKLEITYEGPSGWILALATSDDGASVDSSVWIAGEEGQATASVLDADTLGEDTVWVAVTNAGANQDEYTLKVARVEPSPDDYLPDGGVGGAGCSSCTTDNGGSHPFQHGALKLGVLLLPGLFLRRWARPLLQSKATE